MRELGALRRSCVQASFAVLAMHGSDTLACSVTPPLVQRQGESNEAWESRRNAAEAERGQTPEQFELRKQVRLWDEADMVFVGLISAIKGARFDRNVEFLNAGGKVVVRAKTTWAMIDKSSGRIARVRDEIAAPFFA